MITRKDKIRLKKVIGDRRQTGATVTHYVSATLPLVKVKLKGLMLFH